MVYQHICGQNAAIERYLNLGSKQSTAAEVLELKQPEFAYNVEGTKDETPPSGYDTWTDYWEKNTGDKSPGFCSNEFCHSRLTDSTRVGAHVRLNGEAEDDRAWIVILCDSCNNPNHNGRLWLGIGTKLVRVRMSKIRKTSK